MGTIRWAGDKHRHVSVHVFVDGMSVTKQLYGPSSYEVWEGHWVVFRAAMLMMKTASPSALERYQNGINELTLCHPQC